MWIAIVAGALATLVGVAVLPAPRRPVVRSFDQATLGEYAGVYQWDSGGLVHLQTWVEFGATPQLGAFDESGEVRALYSTDIDRFFAGPGMAIPTAIESRVSFQRDSTGRVVSLTWQRDDGLPRRARHVDLERHEDVRFTHGDVQLAGTLIKPATGEPHPAVVLVHASGNADRGQILPYARFLVSHGMAVLGYDKRGVGQSTGNWNEASFDDLAGDAVAAVEYLKTRRDIDPAQIGLMGLSQAGWVMPLAANRVKDLAFLISIAGAGLPGRETTLDHARREMTSKEMPAPAIEQVIGLMRLQYHFVETGEGWDAYASTREGLAKRMGTPPDTLPGRPDHPYLQFIRRLISYDPTPTLRQLRVPVLAIFGELDNNILPEKHKAAWGAALAAGGHQDYTLVVLPKANHMQLEATHGNNAEMASLRRFVPSYFTTVREWLATRVKGFQ
jgi:dienelactone hydrolase